MCFSILPYRGLVFSIGCLALGGVDSFASVPPATAVKSSVSSPEDSQKSRISALDASTFEQVQEQIENPREKKVASQHHHSWLPFHKQSAAPAISNDVRESWWYRDQANRGDAKAQNNLGVMYYEGRGVPQDYGRAASWYEKSAAQGNAEAEFNLGTLYAFGKGVRQDYHQARQWYEKAAVRKNAVAAHNLGVMYYSAQGVDRDYSRAARWYDQSASLGYARAQRALGFMYENGQGVKQDYTRAAQWYKQAVAEGDVVAEYALGILCVRKDENVAKDWFSKACAARIHDACDALADLKDE